MDLAVSSSPEALTQLRAPWQELFDACPAAPIFLSWEWLSRWWAHFGADHELRLVTVREGGQLVGIAPLMIRHSASSPELRFIGREETTDYADLLTLPGHEQAVVAALLDHVQAFREEAGSVALEPLLEDSPLLHALRGEGPSLMTESSIKIEPIEPCPYIPLASDWDAYLAGLPKKDRHELRRKLRRAEADGPLILDVATDPQEIAERLPVFFSMHRASVDAHKANFLSAEIEAFFTDAFGALAERGWTRLSLLRFGDQPVASAVSFERGDTVSLYNSGFDPAFRALSPGIALVALELQAAIERGRTTYDFMRGNERYKYDLGGRDRFVYRATLPSLTPSPRGGG
ncbi:MAG TPA: GNAT family N-acetyltransferase, partial [Chloroflexota bacterium]